MSKLVREPTASSPAPHSPSEHPSATSTNELSQPPRDLLTAWLLLLFERQPTHGYELRRELEAHGVTTEPSAMYRVLRKLENAGHATSSWVKSSSGPRRRQYQLTAQGQHELNVLAATLTAKRDIHAAFLHAHQQALQDPR